MKQRSLRIAVHDIEMLKREESEKADEFMRCRHSGEMKENLYMWVHHRGTQLLVQRMLVAMLPQTKTDIF